MSKTADTALASVREKIAPLEATLNGLRIAEAALIDAGAGDAAPVAAPKKRGRKKKAGLPVQEQEAGS